MFISHLLGGHTVKILSTGRDIIYGRPSVEYDTLKIGERIQICDLDGTNLRSGTVFLIARFSAVSEIPRELLAMGNDPDCRSRHGLLEKLRRVYGDYSADEDVLVMGFYA